MNGTITGLTSVSDFADELLGEEPGLDLAEAGPACLALTETLDEGEDASALIATIVWDVFCRTEAFQATIRDITRAPVDDRETFVVRHPLFGGRPRHDLLVFDAAMRDSEPQSASIPSSHRAWIAEGIDQHHADDCETSILFSVEGWQQVIEEATAAQKFGLIVAEPPSMIRLSGGTFLGPAPPVHVRRREDAQQHGTAGVVARSADGDIVVTVALHALREQDSEPIPAGTEVWLDHAAGAVVRTHEISDSAIVAPDHPEQLDLRSATVLRGPLRGVTPREGEEMTFEGAVSGKERSFVTGWSPDLLDVRNYNQSKVITTPESVPGDSGAALFDSDGNLIGFAFARSTFDAKSPFSSWIWADSVFSVHKLKPFERISG